MSLQPEVVDFIRQNRGRFSAEAIKAQLEKDGVSAADIDEAFRAADLAPAAAPAGGAGGKAVLAVLAVAGAAGAAFVLHGREQAPFAPSAPASSAVELCAAELPGHPDHKQPPPAELDAYRPPIYQRPADLDRYLPGTLVDADAGPDIHAALREIVSVLGPGAFSGKIDALHPSLNRAFMMLDGAGGKSRNEMTGALVAPKTDLQFLAAVSLDGVVGSFISARYKALAQKAKDEKRYDEVERVGRRQVALAWTLMQDASLVLQMMGGANLSAGLVQIQQAGKLRQTWCRPDREAGTRLALQTAAFLPQKGELAKVLPALTEPLRLEDLRRYLDDPVLRPRYANFVLAQVAREGTRGPAKVESARAAFLAAASRHSDPRVAKAAGGFAALHAQGEGRVEGGKEEALHAAARELLGL